jgi:proline iminopeptidase
LAITPIGAAWIIEALPAEIGELFTVYVAELPGTGGSAGDPSAQSVASVVATIGELAVTISDDPARIVLFGHSMNGTLALAAAAAGNFGGVIAVTPAPSLPPNPQDNAAYWAAKAEPERRRRGAEIIEAYNASADAAEKETLQEAYNHLRQWYDLDFDSSALDALENLDRDFAWVGAMFADAANVDWTATMESVACPVLLALGEYDFMAPMSNWTEANRPRRATTEVFERSAHNPYVEQPQEFVAAVQRWLQANF